MLWIILGLVLILWLFGWSIGMAGNLIHLLAVVALIILIIQLVKIRRD